MNSSPRSRPMADEIPPGLWQYIAGGLATVATGAAAVIGGLFKGQISEVKKEIDELDKRVLKDLEVLESRTNKNFDDIWEVINTERELASQAQTRNYERLEQTPTRKEMSDAFERLGARLDAAMRDRRP